jgi:hypothetical protein
VFIEKLDLSKLDKWDKEEKKVLSVIFVAIAGVVAGAYGLNSWNNASLNASLNDHEKAARVTCFSGNNIIYDNISKGAVLTDTSGQIKFKVAGSDGVLSSTGDCVVDPNQIESGSGFMPIDARP